MLKINQKKTQEIIKNLPEDFELEETPENIVVIEEALIPEDKVIATDKQQSDDLLNQMIKNTQNINNTLIKQQKKILRNLDDCFSSRTLKTEVATTMGKNIIKLKMAAAININNFYSLPNK